MSGATIVITCILIVLTIAILIGVGIYSARKMIRREIQSRYNVTITSVEDDGSGLRLHFKPVNNVSYVEVMKTPGVEPIVGEQITVRIYKGIASLV